MDAPTALVETVDIELDDLSPGESVSEDDRGFLVAFVITELRRDDGTVGREEVHIGIEEPLRG